MFAVSQTWWLVLEYKGTVSECKLVLEMDKQADNFNTSDTPWDGVTVERHLTCIRKQGRVPGSSHALLEIGGIRRCRGEVCHYLGFRLRSNNRLQNTVA